MKLSFMVIPVIVFCIFIISIIMKKMEWLLNFCIRLCLGTLALYIAQNIMIRMNCTGCPGINPVNVLTVGFLGVPGVLLILFLELYYLYGK